VFIYKSVCLQHKTPFVQLPDQVNLGSSRFADYYKQAGIRITGKTPGSFIKKTGKPMVYGITIPKNAPHRKLAIQFLAFVLGPEGREIMKRNGQAPLSPPQVTGDAGKLPDALKPLTR
jgi:molybdate/tungstate transport system substrate-binding protein